MGINHRRGTFKRRFLATLAGDRRFGSNPVIAVMSGT
jgi:hypothetical protein